MKMGLCALVVVGWTALAGAQPIVCEAPCALPVGPLAVEMDTVAGVVLYELLMDGAVLSAPVTVTSTVVTFTLPQGVPAGSHVFQVRTVGGSTAGQTLMVCGANVWAANYFPNTTVTGNPTAAGCESLITHTWGVGGPPGVSVDRFSARWLGSFAFTGPITMTSRSDDGIRAWVDADQLINDWTDHGATTDTAMRTLSGTHVVKVEYYENGGDATAIVGWTAAPVSDPCLADPLTFTVSTWPSQPTGSRLLFYASNKPVTVVLNVTKTPFTAVATDTRGCVVTRTKP